MGRMPDISNDRLAAEESIIFIGDDAESRSQITGVSHLGQFVGYALPALLVEALGKRADDRGLVREILIEGAEGKLGLFNDLAHLQGITAFLFDELGGDRQDFFEAIAA